MPDECLQSIHLDFPRRQDFRQARQTLLEGRGCLTWAAEHMCATAGVNDWSDLVPSDINMGVSRGRWQLVERHTACVWPLKVGLNRIGRFSDNDIVVSDHSVSRRHCVLLVHVSGSCELYDTASLNGTYINGQRLKQ